MNHRFDKSQVDETLVLRLHENPATAFFASMLFQLGCSIGELIAMGFDPVQVSSICAESIANAVSTRGRGEEEKGA